MMNVSVLQGSEDNWKSSETASLRRGFVRQAVRLVGQQSPFEVLRATALWSRRLAGQFGFLRTGTTNQDKRV